jgi:membrane protein CcdC involved in cytochrome C biogenesis
MFTERSFGKNLFRNRYSVAIFFILLINVALRFLFIRYGYITTDEGIALYNTRLAYKGLIPFINFNGWDSLLTSYFVGFPNLFFRSTIIVQRIVALCMALFTLVLSLAISNKLTSQKSIVITALFLTLGSPLYLYYSNIPYSTQVMTLLLVGSLLSLLLGIKSKRHTYVFYAISLVLAVINTAVRSQMIPIAVLTISYIAWQNKSDKKNLSTFLFLTIVTTALCYGPFLSLSIPKTLYALFWPFYAHKTHLYVVDVSARNVVQFINFTLLVFRDYGVLCIILICTPLTNVKLLFKHNGLFILLLMSILCFAFATAIIHTPIDASYIYPFVPLLSILATHFFVNIVNIIRISSTRNFMYAFLFILLAVQFFLYPHFIFIKTSNLDAPKTTTDYLHEISDFIETHTKPTDHILTFYIPAVAEINREVPLYFNEGPGSISLLDTKSANQHFMTSLPQLHEIIDEKKVPMIVFSDSFVHYFGRNENDRQEMLALIRKNYVLIKEFPNYHLADGSKARTLYIYSLPK